MQYALGIKNEQIPQKLRACSPISSEMFIVFINAAVQFATII